jgi:type III pantothenate kinase
VQCIISGGAADMIVPHLSVPSKKVDNLVLIGLQAVATHTR